VAEGAAVACRAAERRALLGELLLGERALLLGGLGLIVALCWARLWSLAGQMDSMAGAGVKGVLAPIVMHQGASMGFSWLLAMWVVMNVAMMLPTAAPMILIHARFVRGREREASALVPSSLFALGYVVVWSGAAVGITLVQLVLERTAGFAPAAMRLESGVVGGAVLAAAGAFQLSPLKNACLTRCRTPIGFFMTSWREGPVGAFGMGVHHGLVCLGCCWALMFVLFVLGAMNLFWVSALTAFMLIEKTAPGGRTIARAGGVALIAAGSVLAFA
jgi:predicted metal-binding membrane protein